MALTYVCSPLSAPTRAEIMVNAQRARTYMTMCEREFGCRAVAPLIYLICLTIPIRKNEHLPYLLAQACLPCVIAWSSMATASVVA